MSKEHAALLREVFIEPIRSVLIVDDDYPTYEDILIKDSPDVSGGKGWKSDPVAVSNVIRSFRSLQVPPVVDIHDGSNIDDGDEKVVAKHLHQSDLLVLDYQLEGAKGDGSKSIEIIKSVIKNSHFNLVVVHTAADLQSAFDDVLMALLPQRSGRTAADKLDEIANKLFSLEGGHKGLTSRLRSAFTVSQYLAARIDARDAKKALIEGREPFAQFLQVCKEVDGIKQQDIIAFCDWFLCEYEDSIQHKLASPDAELVQWSSSEPLWIRSGTAFIAFTNKSRDATIIDDLVEALIDWKPQPSRLFLAKLRAQIDEFGVVAENVVMGSDLVLARWYDHLLSGTEETRKTLIGDSIDRHTEQLIANIRDKVEVFAEKVVAFDLGRKARDEDVVNDYFKIDLANESKRRKAERDHNIFVSSKPPSGWHLHTGHVFECDDSTWICLSPACDLVPRPRPAYVDDLGPDTTSFIAVKLHDKGDGLTSFDDIQSNRYIYVRVNGDEKLFSFNESSNSNPYWSAMYALNQGKFEPGMTFKISRIKRVGETLEATTLQAKVVGQLRYEYALNLVQKLGGAFTRVGLDFSG